MGNLAISAYSDGKNGIQVFQCTNCGAYHHREKFMCASCGREGTIKPQPLEKWLDESNVNSTTQPSI